MFIVYGETKTFLQIKQQEFILSLMTPTPIPDKLQKLQRIQNSAARLVLGRSKYDHATPMLRELHWHLRRCLTIEGFSGISVGFYIHFNKGFMSLHYKR